MIALLLYVVFWGIVGMMIGTAIDSKSLEGLCWGFLFGFISAAIIGFLWGEE